jgi:hypothetical protein
LRIVSAVLCTDGHIIGYVELEKEYKWFKIGPNDTLTYRTTYEKDEYRNYEHFAGVIGKFDPYQPFLENPVTVERMEYDAVLKIAKKTKY